MDHKVLYTNKEVKIKAIVALAEEDPGEARRSSCFLAEGQQKCTLLFIGTSEGVIQSLQLKVTGPELRVTMEPRSKIMVSAPPATSSAEAEPALSSAHQKTLEGVSFLFALPSPFAMVVAILGGRWLALQAATLQMVKQETMQYACPSRIQLCCLAEAQETSFRALGDTPAHRFLCIGTDRLARQVELTQSGVRGLRSLTNTAAVSPTTFYDDGFQVEEGVCSVVWRGDLILTASTQAVAAYDAISQTMQYRLDVSGQLRHLTALVRCLPGGAYNQERVPLHFPEVPQPVSSGALLQQNDAGLEGEGGEGNTSRAQTTWSRSDRLLFRTDNLVLVQEIPETVEEVDLLGASVMEVGIAGLQDVLVAPPYFIAVQQNRAVLFYMDEKGAFTPVDNREGVCFSDKCVMHRLTPFSGGLLCFSEHTIEVAQWKPLSKQLQLFVEDGQYNTAIRLFNDWAPFATEEEANDEMTALYRLCAEHGFRHKRFAESFACYYLADTPLKEFLGLFPELLRPEDPNLVATSEVNDINVEEDDDDHTNAGAPSTVAPALLEAMVPIKTTRASRFLYEALYNILKVYWRRPSGEEGTVSENSGSSNAFNSEEDMQLLEFAFFVLILFFFDANQAADPTLTAEEREASPFFVGRDEAEDFLLHASRLPHSLCRAITGETGPFPRPSLTPLLLAAEGRLPAALEECERLEAVETACRILHTAASTKSGADDPKERREQLHTLYAAHLPWMLCGQEDVVLAFLTTPHVGAPPVEVTLPLLLGVGGMSLFLYLHYLLYTQGCTKKMVHNTYAVHLIEMIVALRSFLTLADGAERDKTQELLCQQWHCTADDLAFAKLPAGLETGLLGNARHQLCTFLKEDDHYDEELVHTHLYAAGLFEERVVLLQHQGDHLGVLKLLVYDLDDLASAEQYCLGSQEGGTEAVQESSSSTGTRGGVSKDKDKSAWGLGESSSFSASRSAPGKAIAALTQALQFPSLIDRLVGPAGHTEAAHRSINIYFHILLHVLLHPPEGHTARREQATYLLNRWAHVMSDTVVLETLPGDMAVAEVADYVIHALHAAERDAVALTIEAAAARAVLAQVTARHTAVQRRFVCVSGVRQCTVCGRRLWEEAEGMFVVYPNLKTAHFRCQCDAMLDPERGVLFGTGV